tara:strand:+ start:1587 stop:1970 length:384 start_codon:yes stop_codon:yes gene_type:complete
MSILKAFNNHFKEFLQDMILVFPHDTELKTSNVFMEGLIKMKPRSVLEVWKVKINDVYQEEIKKGDYNFFIEKNYDEDVGNGDNKLTSSIKKMQKKISNMTKENKIKAMKYVQNLTKLCNLYFINKP